MTEHKSVTVRTDRPRATPEAGARLLLVDVTAPRPQQAQRAPVSLGLALDRSGSMSGQKLELAIAAARQAIGALDERDRFAVVAFDSRVDVVVPACAATRDAVASAAARLDAVKAEGNTDLSGGWLTACGEIGGALSAHSVARCIVLTDGQANHGITDANQLARHARELRLRRVTTSALGLGAGFNEFLLGRLAEEGGGNFHFAERADQLAAIVGQEVGAVLSVVAHDVTIRVRAPAGVVVDSLNNFACAREGSDWVFTVGSLSTGQVIGAAFRLRLPSGDDAVDVDVSVGDRDGVFAGAHPVVLPRARDAARDAVDRAVVRAAAHLDAACARRAALELNQTGKPDDAGRAIDAAVAALRDLAEGDADVTACADALAAERARYARPMSSMSSKLAFVDAMRSQKMQALRGVTGLVAASTSPALAAAALAARASLQGLPGLPHIDVVDAPAQRGADLDAAAERALVDAVGNGLGVTVVFVEQSLQDGWFSHWHAAQKVAVVSSFGFAHLTGLPLSAFVAYELLFHGLRTQSDRYDPIAIAHKEVRGCLFDLCVEKAEIAVKLQAGHVCPDCAHTLGGLRIDAGRVERLWSAVQALAHPV